MTNARSDRLEQVLIQAADRAPFTTRNEILQMGAAADPRSRLFGLALARKRIEAGDDPSEYYEFARRLVADADNDCRWQAVIVVGELVDSDPEAVWDVVEQFGDSPDSDMRTAVATVLLEELLDRYVEEYFPCVRDLVEPVTSTSCRP